MMFPVPVKGPPQEIRSYRNENLADVMREISEADPQSDYADEQRRFYKFKNILYKSVKI